MAERTSARRLMRARAKTFYLATLFMPSGLRSDVRDVYAFCRMIDDLVDLPDGRSYGETARTLERIDRELQDGTSQEPAVARFIDLAGRRRLPLVHAHMLLDGVRWDLDRQAIETLDDLRRYAELVAGSVGMLMAGMLGASHAEGLAAARDLGVAMQLTNIVRDVNEDLDHHRIYLPIRLLDERGARDALSRRQMDEALREVVASVVLEARRLYSHGFAGLQYVDPAARFAVFLAARLYSGILDKIERCDYDVFSGRANLGTLEKWGMALPLYMEHRWRTAHSR